MDAIRNFWTMHFSWLQLPTLSIRWTDILEIIILSFFIYHFLIWFSDLAFVFFPIASAWV